MSTEPSPIATPEMTASLDERLKLVPLSPGIYIWKDAQGTILYVGKSKSLRDRMRSYFGSPRSLTAKTRRLMANVVDFEIIVTSTELEALLLEMNLIKQHRPRYNILLKDDKTYPYIKVTLNEEWPRVFQTRRMVEDGARYFGPYASASSVRSTLDLLNRLFAFRPYYECGDEKFRRHRRMNKPCLYHDMKRCLGPCVPGLISVGDYRAAIDSVCRFLEGKSDQIVRKLKADMEEASEELRFERAAALRDRLKALENVLQRQQVLRTVNTDQDVIAFAREEGSAVVQVMFIRGGKLIGTEPYTLQGAEDESDSSLLASFVTQFYQQAPEVPPRLLLADYVEEPMIIERWLGEKRGQRVEIEVPRRGEKRRLVEMAVTNAQQKLGELRSQWLNSEQRAVAGLTEIRDLLGLDGLPMRIECYDISNTQGTNSVASMVVFEQGEPKTAHYRRFKIKTVDGANDVASLREVLLRRFSRAAQLRTDVSQNETSTPVIPKDMPGAEDEGADENVDGGKKPKRISTDWGALPDLLLVDGGIGQVNAAYGALAESGFGEIPVVGVVKGVNRDRFDLLPFGGDELIVLERDSKAVQLIRRVDEEAHRFAITYHRKLRTKKALTSQLDTIRGVGPKRKKALIKAFGSLDGIRNADVEAIAAVPGMTRAAAESLKSQL